MFENLSAVLSSEYRIVQATEMKKSVCNKKYTVSNFYKYCSLTPFFLALTHILSYFFEESNKGSSSLGKGAETSRQKGADATEFYASRPGKTMRIVYTRLCLFQKRLHNLSA